MEVSIKMTSNEALSLIKADLLAPVLEHCSGNEPSRVSETITPAPAPTTPAPIPVATTPEPQALADEQHASVQVPTQAHQYTLDEISRAAVFLMDRGKQSELLALLKTFEVNSVADLKQEQFGQFATELRQRGAQI